MLYIVAVLVGTLVLSALSAYGTLLPSEHLLTPCCNDLLLYINHWAVNLWRAGGTSVFTTTLRA